MWHLIKHEVGIWGNKTGDGDPMFDSNFQLEHKELIQKTINNPKHKLKFAPGDTLLYSNFGYCLLGRVIERISG